jgi:major membrane immunogen (membrane-anchored lipoprotein)
MVWHMKKRFKLFVITATLFLASCAGLDSRIKKNPEMFARLSAEQQSRVKEGKVQIGDSRDMVYLAFGQANRSYSRTTEHGVAEVWAYTRTDYRVEPKMVRGTYHYRDEKGRLRTGTDTTWVDVEHREEYDAVRVEFSGDRVSAIDRIKQ